MGFATAMLAKGYGISDENTENAYDEKDKPKKVSTAVDYDVNPTVLYTLIESKDWAECIERIANAEEEASTWIYRKESNGSLRWRLLPIHAAIIFSAPHDVIEKLLLAYPDATKEGDDRGMLPLHIAFRNDATDKVMYLLLCANPDAITTKDKKGRIPLKLHNTRIDRPEEGSIPQSPPSTPRSILNKERDSGFEKYVSIARQKEREIVTEELNGEFSEKIAALTQEHKKEIEQLREEARDEATKAEEKLKELDDMMKTTRSASVAVMDKYRTKCEDEEKARGGLERVSMELEEVKAARKVETARLHQQNVILDGIALELKQKVKDAEKANETSEKKIIELEDTVAASQGRCETLEFQMSETRKACEKLLGNYRQKCDREVELQKTVTGLRRENVANVGNKELEINTLVEQNLVLQATVIKLEKQVNSLQSDGASNETKVSSIADEKVELDRECELLRAQVKMGKEDNVQLSTSLQQAREECEKSTEEAERFRQQVNAMSLQLAYLSKQQENIVQAAAKQEEDFHERLKQLNDFAVERLQLDGILTVEARDAPPSTPKSSPPQPLTPETPRRVTIQTETASDALLETVRGLTPKQSQAYLQNWLEDL